MRKVSHPGEIVSPVDFSRKREIDYALGTIGNPDDPPRVLYLAEPGGTTLAPAVIVEPFTIEDKHEKARTARAELRGDEHHRRWCGRAPLRVWERASCGTCALLGWSSPHDDEAPAGHPNHTAWPLIYLAAREPIPRAWFAALVEDLNDEDNTLYRENVRRHVATFGYSLTDSRPGYRLPGPPSPDSVVAYLQENEPDDIIEALKPIIRDPDGEYETAVKRAAFRALNRLTAPAEEVASDG